MRKTLFVWVIACLILFNSCSVQEKVSPDILIKRLETKCVDLVFDNEGYYKGNDYYIFAVYESLNTAFKFKTDDSGTVYKVSVSFIIGENRNIISPIIEPVISVFSPREISDEVLKDLLSLKKEYNYYYGQDYTYSLIENEKNIYFEVFNNKLSGYTIPELTLKENDKSDF